MARIGARYPKGCPYTVTQNSDGTEDEALLLGKVLGKAISVNVTVNQDDGEQHADDGLAEAANGFTGGTIALELNDLTDESESFVTGSVFSEDGELISDADDNPPFMRFGYVEPHQLNNVKSYRAIVFMRVKFSPPGSDSQSKAASTTFGSSTLNGKIMRNKDGKWRRRKTFATQSEAVAYLNQMVNIGGTIPTFSQTSVPVNGATGASKTDPIVITFTNVVDHGNATLVNASTNAVVSAAKVFDGTKKILTITPAAALAATTEYLVVLDVTDAYAQQLSAVISFTTGA